MLSTSCEFYYNDVTVTSFISIRYGKKMETLPLKASPKEQPSVYCFIFWQKDSVQMPFSLKCVQCMVTRVL